MIHDVQIRCSQILCLSQMKNWKGWSYPIAKGLVSIVVAYLSVMMAVAAAASKPISCTPIAICWILWMGRWTLPCREAWCYHFRLVLNRIDDVLEDERAIQVAMVTSLALSCLGLQSPTLDLVLCKSIREIVIFNGV